MNTDTNFNTDFYNNFEAAFFMSEKDFSHEELLKMLKFGNVSEREIAALKFDFVSSEEDASALINALTGCDGKIREAVAFKINQMLLSDNSSINYFSKYPEIFADGTIDINANICRQVLDSAVILKSNEDFAKKYAEKIMKFAKDSIVELDKFIFRDKKYVINKQLFKLYWCLNALKYFHEYVSDSELEEILLKCIHRKDYTIREKTAQILVGLHKFQNLAEELKSDENYYVRNVFKSS